MKIEKLNKMRKRINICFYAENPSRFIKHLIHRKYPKNYSNKILRRYTLFENKHLIRKILFTAQLKK